MTSQKERKEKSSELTRLIRKRYLAVEKESEAFLEPMQEKSKQLDKVLDTITDSLVQDYLAQNKILIDTRIILEENNQLTLLMLLALSQHLDRIDRWMRHSRLGQITKEEQAAEDKFDTHLAKRLSQLFETQGHEAMYGTGQT